MLHAFSRPFSFNLQWYIVSYFSKLNVYFHQTGRRRPDSSSSASSSATTATTTDWEGAATLTMIRRHAPIPSTSAPALPSTNAPALPPPRHSSHSSDSSDITAPPPRNSRLSVAPESHCIQDHIIATQLRRLQHQLAPISDVYHERRLGLGLAPTLSSLLMEQAAEQHLPTGNIFSHPWLQIMYRKKLK